MNPQGIRLLRAAGLLTLSVALLLVASGAAAKTRGFVPGRHIVPTPVLNGSFHALVIGNNAYDDPTGTWPSLDTAINDAEVVARTLKSDYGFRTVTLLRDATRRDLIAALNTLAESVEPRDSVLIYYAGHGLLREDTQEGFWVPVDGRGTDDSTFLSNAVLRTKLAVIADRAKHVLLISDSCFSGALIASKTRGMAQPAAAVMKRFERIAQNRSVQVLAAGGLEYVDDNYEGTGHSPFTYFLLQALEQNRQRYLSATLLSRQVRDGVTANVPQEPVMGPVYGAGHEGGEFIFVRVGGIAPSQEVTLSGLGLDDPTAREPAPAWQRYGLLGAGALFSMVAVLEYQNAVSLYDEAETNAREALLYADPALYDKSIRQEAEAEDALNVTRLSLVGAAVSFGVYYWLFWDEGAEGEPAAESVRIELLPAVSRTSGSFGSGIRVAYRW